MTQPPSGFPPPQQPGQPGQPGPGGQMPPQQPGMPPQGPPPGMPPQGPGGPGGPGGPPPGYGGAPQGGGNNKKMIIIIAASVVGVLLIGGLGLWWFLSPSSASSAKEAAELYYEAIEDTDEDQFKKVLCDKDLDRFNDSGDSVGDAAGAGDADLDVEYEVTDEKDQEFDGYDEGAIVEVKITGTATFNGQETNIDRTEKLPVVKEDGDWKVCHSAGSTYEPEDPPTPTMPARP